MGIASTKSVLLIISVYDQDGIALNSIEFDDLMTDKKTVDEPKYAEIGKCKYTSNIQKSNHDLGNHGNLMYAQEQLIKR